MTTISESIALRQWIKGALHSNDRKRNTISDGSSSEYIAASLAIAVSLTEQISRAEKLADLGVYRALELLPIGADIDWAEFVWISLNTDESRVARHESIVQKANVLLDQYLPREPCPTGGIEDSRWENENAQTIDEHMEVFLESLHANEFEAAHVDAQHLHHSLAPSPITRGAQNESVFFHASSSEAKNANYLYVDSAEDELASIQTCYQRSVTESCELAIITGESGTGKSWLARRVGGFIAAQGGLFLTGKFDQMKLVTPFSALASAFDQYCDVLIKEKETDWAQRIVNQLNVTLGRDSCHLINVIPKLSHILTSNVNPEDSLSSQNCVNALQRLHYLICQFVDVISKFSVVSVTLFLDDVQWADTASIAVLSQLLLKRYKRFFVLGCCRGPEMENDHPIRDMIENVSSFGTNITVVKLKCMEKDTLDQVVSELLCLPPRVVRSLSHIIYTKTKGNPLFVSQLMRSLSRDGLLRLSLSRQRWVWEEKEIQSMQLPDDVALYFTDGISKLPMEVQSALRTVSMFGASVKCEYIEAIESQLSATLIEPLKVASAEGLVSNLKGSFHFCHDRIQEASYAMIEEHDRCRDHLTFGLCLVKLSLNTNDPEMLFAAVNQINFAGPAAVSDTQEYSIMATYNLMAGKRAMEMSDFLSAFSFFSFGIDFLPDQHWTDHYDLSLELFDLASKSALATGNIQSLRILVDEVFRNSRSFEDQLNTHFVIISSLAYTSKITEAMEKGNTILSRLGEVIPNNPSKEALDEYIQQTQSLIRGVSENDILSLRLVTDKSKLAAMKFLAQLESITVMAKPALHPFVTLKMVQLTMLHGLSPVSPIGFVYFGSLLAKRGSIQLGHRFTLLAKALLEKLESEDIAGEVICVATEVLRFVEPLQTANESLATLGESAAMKEGDIRWACINRLQYCSMMFWACPNLSVVKIICADACQFMKEHEHRASLLFMLPIQKTVLLLIGCTETSMDQEQSRTTQHNKNARHLIVNSFHDLYRSFILDNDGMEKEHCEKFFKSTRNSWFLYFGDSAQALIIGLVSFHVYRETGDSMWLERGRKCEADMKLWAEQGSFWNFQHKLMLLEAEDHYSNGNFENAELSYKNAISSARSHKFMNDEALACELAARFYLGTGDLASSLAYFKLAHEKYICWGAFAKADRLFASINKKFSNVLEDNSIFVSTVSNSRVMNVQCAADIDPRKRRAE
ncbi:hypothetical protein ACHAW6_015800 [Cyclotella cf. meneghiniana]